MPINKNTGIITITIIIVGIIILLILRRKNSTSSPIREEKLTTMNQENIDLANKIQKNFPWIDSMENQNSIQTKFDQSLLIPNRSLLGQVRYRSNPELKTILGAGLISGEKRDSAVVAIRPRNLARGLQVPLGENPRYARYASEHGLYDV